jgi:hypothetical protein
MGRDITVGIATCCWLNGLGIESHEVARFSAPTQNSPGVRIPDLFPRDKRARGKALSTHSHIGPRLKKE